MELKINNETLKTVQSSYGDFFSSISGVAVNKIVDDVLSFEKPKEQIALLQRFSPEIKGKKLLEVGSGFGNFIVVARKLYAIDAYGIEPSGDGFDDSLILAKNVLSDNKLSPDIIVDAKGEALPFVDNLFDICYSSNVLEHVDDPNKVLSEMIRVTKPGGIIQVVVPNYGSFFEGHYAVFYLPYQPKWLWKLWIKFVLKRDLSFVDTLRTNLNYFSIKRMVSHFVKGGNIKILSWGEDVFKERMSTANFSDWAGLGKVKIIVRFLQKIKVASFITNVLLYTKAFTPIILTIRKDK